MLKPTLLQELRSQSQVDCDTLDVDVAKSLHPFVDCTSNQAIALGEVQKPANQQLVKDSVLFARENLARYEGVTEAELAVEVMMVKLSSRIIPYLTGYVHTQTNPFNSYSTINTIKNAERIISLYKALDPAFDVSRVCIKIPSTWEGLQACRTLQAKGISTLATTLFSMPQVVLAADAGCTYIAPYVNELKVHFVEGYEDKNKAFALCHAAQSYYKTHSLHTQVLPASLTNISEVMALAGVHHITVSPPLLKQLSETPGTGAGTGKPNLFPEKSKLDGFEMDGYEDILGEDSEAKWRMACTLSDAGRDEEKLVQAINIFVGCQRKLEGFAVEVGKGL